MRAGPGKRRPRATVLYHYMHPDDVVSARLFDGLAEGLAARGWDVTAMPSNRGCRDESQAYPRRELWHGVGFDRVWRPAWRQASTAGRLGNAAWMAGSWAALAGRSPPADVTIVGTDPILSVAVAPLLARRTPSMRIAHWAHDLYPEAAVADGLLPEQGAATRALRAVAGAGYRACHLVADIGPCMRERIREHHHAAREATLVPWALSEPATPIAPSPAVRRELFGDAALGILYSGTYGRAHEHETILALARRLRDAPVRFCFAVRGNRADELRRAVRPDDTNVGFAGFCSEAELEARLAAADVHVATLRPEWSGIVVPSKFFGSLAAGRPVLFSGAERSSIARWIREHDVGWVATPDRLEDVADEVRKLAADRASLEALWRRCHRVYERCFSRARTLDRWDDELRALVP